VPSIEELLHRRTDLSTFLVHLCRTTDDGVSARDHLLGILVACELRRGQPLGLAAHLAAQHEHDQPAFYESQRVVCFTETPLEHTWMMCTQIDNRQISFQPYGLAFTKTWARLAGINPVWYVDNTPNARDWLTNPVNRIAEGAAADGAFDHDIFQITPFIETMGRLGEAEGRRPKEFWWEREWRRAGANVNFLPNRLVAVLVPEDDHAAFAAELDARRQYAAELYADLRYLDPRWGLERMIAALSGIREELAHPFPPFPPPAV
jgi:hypothetical protein